MVHQMKFKSALVVLLLALNHANASPADACPDLLKHTFLRLQDEVPQPLCQYQGKVLLVVNTASLCGFTGQYEGLEKLYAKYKDRGLVVMGFPSNDFGDQEPGSNKEIADFCRLTYGIRFPMMSKTDIAAPKTHPFFKQLISATDTRPKWNFHKYLIDRSGTRVESFNTLVSPDSSSLIAAIEKRLAEKP
jgi:glutathione peroxidase